MLCAGVLCAGLGRVVFLEARAVTTWYGMMMSAGWCMRFAESLVLYSSEMNLISGGYARGSRGAAAPSAAPSAAAPPPASPLAGMPPTNVSSHAARRFAIAR